MDRTKFHKDESSAQLNERESVDVDCGLIIYPTSFLFVCSKISMSECRDPFHRISQPRTLYISPRRHEGLWSFCLYCVKIQAGKVEWNVAFLRSDANETLTKKIK